MTVLDTAIRQPVADILAEFGTSVTITNPGATFDPSDASVGHANAAQTVKVSPPSVAVDTDGFRNVETGDMKMMLSPLASGYTFAPKKDHVLDFAGKSWAVVQVVDIYSGDDIAAFKLQLRA